MRVRKGLGSLRLKALSNNTQSHMHERGVLEIVLEEGDGVTKPQPGDVVEVEYMGWLYDRAQAANFYRGKQFTTGRTKRVIGARNGRESFMKDTSSHVMAAKISLSTAGISPHPANTGLSPNNIDMALETPITRCPLLFTVNPSLRNQHPRDSVVDTANEATADSRPDDLDMREPEGAYIFILSM
ncbi:hypothetical protein GP486_001935 [Trichoglossum hirsutum]|uniref:Uncharacterized protein n=1 Tax=Trichoglossum hirsutum TaxID=265104 RepID=A0A9P8LG64_9PEZI|nr:hypothetical protein GP486_001935 [Trichoglossum hirsutum]